MPFKSNLEELALIHSRFAYQFSCEGVHAVYHPFFMNSFYLNNLSFEAYNMFKNGNLVSSALRRTSPDKKQDLIELISNLHERSILVDVGDNENRFKQDIQIRKGKGEIDIQLIYILTTDACNLACGYCFIERALPKEHRFVSMSPETARKGIDIFFANSSPRNGENRKVLFYGGEPTLNLPALQEGVTYIRSSAESDRTNISMITNGTRLTQTLSEFLVRNNVEVSLSIDGTEKEHNAARSYLGGNGTFNDVMRGYQELKKAGSDKVGISLTIGRHNVMNLRKIVESITNTFDVKGIGFNFITDFPFKRNPFAVDIDLATEKALEAFDYLRKKGIYEDRIMRKLKPFVEAKIKLKDCGAIGNQIVLAPDGSIGPCQAYLHSKKYFDHHVSEGQIDLKEDPIYKEWARRMPINIDACYDCPAITICGGGCAYQAEITKGSMWNLDERMCKHNKKLLEWAIWETYHNMGVD